MSTPSATMERVHAEELSRSRADQLREQNVRTGTWEAETTASGTVKPAIGGMGWYVVLALAILGDFIGALLDLSLFLTVVTTLLGWFIAAVIWIYYYMHDVGFVDKKLIAYLVALIVTTLPMINALPELTIMFVVVRSIENQERLHHNTKVYQAIRRGLEYAEAHRLGL